VTTHSISSWAFHPSVYTHPNGKRLKKDAVLQPTASGLQPMVERFRQFHDGGFRHGIHQGYDEKGMKTFITIHQSSQ
jgi:hypothetical protein